MKKFAVIGHPINHSKSPALHQAGFAELEIDATFEAIDVKPEELRDWMINEVQNYAGVAVTIPHKESILPFVDKLTEASKSIGAINTLYWENEVLFGTNTDCIGALKALQTEVPNLDGKDVLILGAGGAARAIIFALRTANANITLWNRTPEKAENLAEEFEVETTEELQDLSPEKFDIIVNTTSVGLKEWKSIIPEDFWSPHHTAFDIVYDPMETKFLSDAADREASTVTGDLMLSFQALEQFHLWHKVELEPQVMEKAFFLE